MPLTPADVRNKQFSTTRLRPGYDEEEVDAFLDEVEAELDRLIQENEELRAKLAEVLRGGKMASPLNSPHMDGPDLMQSEPLRVEPERRQPEPMPMAPMKSSAEDNMDTAARVLALAQQTADQAIADARREADETLSRAAVSEQITSDARARAESLERDAQERHRQAMGSLVQSREELERRVDDLRAFEREYRSRLKAYLEGQLRDLEAGAADSGVFPAVQATGPQPAIPVGMGARMDMRNGGASTPTGSFAGMSEPVVHNGGYHPADTGQHDRR
jgi:DivIVA domain-containing protein